MDLTRLFELQRKLDAEIEEKHPTEKRDRIEDKFLALYTEIAECANEHRGFKFWSNNREPRTMKVTDCSSCIGTGDINAEASLEMLSEGHDAYDYEECGSCNGTGKAPATNPLLEEYVDGIHFLLSLGLEFGFEKVDFVQEAKEYAEVGTRFKEQTLTRQFNGIYYMATQFESDHQESDYIELVLSYLALGEMLGFTWEQVVQAYMSKNDENHTRQETGY